MTTLTAKTDNFIIAHLSDLHLSPHKPHYQTQFLQILALAQRHEPDLLLLTGDLVNDGDKSIYDWLFDTLQRTGIAFACVAGNHDVTYEVGATLAFEKRTFLPITPDKRLLHRTKLDLMTHAGTWQLLLLDSTVSGQIFGRLDQETLAWLSNSLLNDNPTLIALHHPPVLVGSAWIDAYCLQNRQAFWQCLSNAPHVHAILTGHVHQAHALPAPTQHQCTVYTTPATSRQFLPHRDDFALDTLMHGFGLITLSNQNKITSQIIRYQSNSSIPN